MRDAERLYDVGARGESGRSPTWEEFSANPRAEYLGTSLTPEEIEENSGWLYDHKFIDGPTIDACAGPIRPHLTSRGIDCVERAGGDPLVFDGGTRLRPSTRDTHVNVHGGNVQIATGDYARQQLNVGTEIERIDAVLEGVMELLAEFRADEIAELRRLKADAIAALRRDPPSSVATVHFGERCEGSRVQEREHRERRSDHRSDDGCRQPSGAPCPAGGRRMTVAASGA